MRAPTGVAIHRFVYAKSNRARAGMETRPYEAVRYFAHRRDSPGSLSAFGRAMHVPTGIVNLHWVVQILRNDTGVVPYEVCAPLRDCTSLSF